MKKKLKAELVSLAHKILQLRDSEQYSVLAREAQTLHEKLAILAYAEKLDQAGMPTIGLKEVEESLQKHSVDIPNEVAEPEVVEAAPAVPETPAPKAKTPSEIAAENEARFTEARKSDKHRPDGTEFNTQAPLHEPVIEKIKDMVAEMPPEAAAIDELIESIEPKANLQKNDMFEIGGEYAQMPIFEPVTAVEDDKPKNLNDKLKTGLKIGLNDKIAFIKHLFLGSDTDYNRVLSQLNTFNTPEEAPHLCKGNGKTRLQELGRKRRIRRTLFRNYSA